MSFVLSKAAGRDRAYYQCDGGWGDLATAYRFDALGQAIYAMRDEVEGAQIHQVDPMVLRAACDGQFWKLCVKAS